jgi:archaeosine synthase
MVEYRQEATEAICMNKLRDLVESLPDITAKSLLRVSDLFYYTEIEPFYPVWEKELNAVQFDSLFRPDIKRFIFRVNERYQKPLLYNTLVLLPCSAKKPYSDSKSHRFFRSIIEDTGKMVHEVIVTSPIAVVPRELETVYPAQNYDLSVIGQWNQDEIKLIIEQVKKYVENNRYENIIAYLPEDLEFLRDMLLQYGAEVIIGNLKNTENIKKLKDLISSSNSPNISRKYQTKEEIKAVIRYQFGDIFDNVLEKLTMIGPYPNIDILLDNEHFMHFNRKKGEMTLSLKAAKMLADKNRYSVTIGNFEPKGTVFAVGILDATEDIRKEDEVAIIIEGQAVGAGTAKMNYIDMKEQEYGEAVKIRVFKK